MAPTATAFLTAPPLSPATSHKRSNAFFKPLPVRPTKAVTGSKTAAKFQIKASLREKAVTGLTAAALTASMLMPEVAEAAEIPPSLKNLLLSVVAGGVVATAIIGAVIAVSNFDPVKRS